MNEGRVCNSITMLLHCVFSVILGTLMTFLTEACSPTGQGDFEDIPYERRAHLYDYVLVGRVLGSAPDPRFDYGGGSDAYTAALKVYCSYKGERQPPIVNITEAGVIPGHCHASELISGREYIIMAMKVQQGLKILREIPLSKGVLQAFIRACGLTLRFPTSLQDDPEGRCLQPAPPGECVENPKATPSDNSHVPTQNTGPNDSPSDTKNKLKSDHENNYQNEIHSSEPPQKHAVVCVESSSQKTTFSYVSALLMIICVTIYS